MSKNSRIESLHKGDQGCTLDGLLDYLSRDVNENKMRKEEKSHISAKNFVPKNLSFFSTNNLQIHIHHSISRVLGADSSVSQDTSNVRAEIHKFAMSNNVKFEDEEKNFIL